MTAPEPEAVASAVVVTGGGSGIGRATALAAADRGAAVAVLDLDAGKATETAGLVEARGSTRAIGIECDVRDEGSVTDAVGKSADSVGEIRGLVTCAGVFSGGLVHELPLETWRHVLDTNLTGTYLTCKHVLAHMLAHGNGGSIVCASSPVAGAAVPGGAAAYCASKGAISALVRSLAIDYASHSIRVNAIVPGATETALMWAGLPPEDIPSMREKVNEQLALGRLAEPEEIAEGVVWLLSERASYVTGSHLAVDGGLMARASIDA
jgi:NAD(P)-dependent dehydrogenase (short-subunit alcohol dehydrogenase family)